MRGLIPTALLTLAIFAIFANAVGASGALGAPLQAPGAPAPEIRALIDRVTTAYGGRKALEKVRAYRVEGSVFSTMRHSDAPTIRVFARPAQLKVLIDYANGAEARLVDGAKGWRNEAGGPLEPVTGPMYAAMVLQAARAGVPWVLYEHAAEATFTDSLTQADVRCVGIELLLGEGLVLRAWIDPATHHVVRSQGLLEHGGMRTHFETVYADFRAVDGVTFAFREENFASGRQTGLTTITKVVVNPPLRANEFQPPDGVPPTPAPGAGRGGS
ncbi:MAG: hypothetical protein IPJ04_08775 [Candidatus Eisenbacteria bacterium]|nr:hypothetical protein [Candidatus Eisenbacteria bacterium]